MTAQNIRFTGEAGVLYAIMLSGFENAVIKSLGSGSALAVEQIASIELLGSPETLTWSQEADGLLITTPAQRPCDHAYSFKITLK